MLMQIILPVAKGLHHRNQIMPALFQPVFRQQNVDIIRLQLLTQALFQPSLRFVKTAYTLSFLGRFPLLHQIHQEHFRFFLFSHEPGQLLVIRCSSFDLFIQGRYYLFLLFDLPL